MRLIAQISQIVGGGTQADAALFPQLPKFKDDCVAPLALYVSEKLAEGGVPLIPCSNSNRSGEMRTAPPSEKVV